MAGLRFIDLFCGIGGFRFALEELGHACVFSSDDDPHAQKTYSLNFGETPCGDLTEIEASSVASHDVLCAGFPCQPFSKSGAQEGFEDQTRGTLFHDICYLAEKHSPAVLFLENVPNLVAHDNGNTMKVIEARIEEIGYKYWRKIISPHNYGTCQIRKRVYIVCIRNDLVQDFDYTFPKERQFDLDIRTVLDQTADAKYSMNKDEIYSHPSNLTVK